MLCSLALAAAIAAATTGSGVTKTEKRPLAPFTQIQQSGSFEVDVVAGDAGADVTADDNIVALIVTEVKDGVLKIHTKDGESVNAKTPVVIKVTAPSLAAFESSGSGKSSVADVPSKQLSLSVSGSGALTWKGAADAVTLKDSGSGSATLTGKAAKLDASLSGSGKVDASAFEVADATSSVSGSGKLQVNATNTLDVKISGSGKVVYSGNPKVTKKISGSGSVESKDGVAVADPKKKAGGGW